MKQLLEFILAGILGKEKFTVTESSEADFVNLGIKTDPNNLGLVIGREGKTIKAIRNILKIKATLEKKAVAVNLEE